VEKYLDQLPPERREVVRAVRDLVAAAMPEGYTEGVAFGMITWCIPLQRYPDTYNGGSWKVTKPRDEITAMAEFNDEKNNNLRRLCDRPRLGGPV